MRRSGYQPRLAAHFVQPQLTTVDGTIFVAPRPVDLEGYFTADHQLREELDGSLSAFEQLLSAAQYELMLSLTWGRAAASQTLDLGLLRAGSNQIFVVHQVNDDAGTSLIVAYLSASAPARLVAPFLIDYLASRGSAYMVKLPDLLPQAIWIARPDLAPHAAVARGLLGLVGPAPAGDGLWEMVGPSIETARHQGGLSQLA